MCNKMSLHLFLLLIMVSSQVRGDELLQRWKGPRKQTLSLYWRTNVYCPHFLQFKQRLPVTTYKLIYTYGKTERTIWWRQQIEAPSTPDCGPADFQCCWKDEETVGFSFMYGGMYLFFSEWNIRKQAPKIPRPTDQPAEQGKSYLLNAANILGQEPAMSSFHLLHHLKLPSYATARKPGNYWCTLKEMKWLRKSKKWHFIIEVEKALSFEDIVIEGKIPETFRVTVASKDGKQWLVFRSDMEK